MNYPSLLLAITCLLSDLAKGTLCPPRDPVVLDSSLQDGAKAYSGAGEMS